MRSGHSIRRCRPRCWRGRRRRRRPDRSIACRPIRSRRGRRERESRSRLQQAAPSSSLRGKFDPLENEMPARDENGSASGKAGRIAGVRCGHAWATATPLSSCNSRCRAIVEQAECRIAALLNFGKHDAGADGVDGAGRDVDDVVLRNRAPVNQIGDRAIPGSRPAIAGALPDASIRRHLRARLRPKECTMPRSCRSASPSRGRTCRPGEPGSTMVRLVNSSLRSSAGCERRPCRPARTTALRRHHQTVNAAPGPEITDPPGFVNDPHGGMFGRHRLS